MSFEAWSVHPSEFPKNGPASDQLAFAARIAMLAPSSHNSQPWQFVIHGNRLDLKADRTRALPVVDPDDRELTISCGAALFYVRLALRFCGHEPLVDRNPDCVDNDVLATVRLGGGHTPTSEDELLFAAIKMRHTNRRPFSTREVTPELVFALIEDARQEGGWLYPSSGTVKEALAELTAAGDHLQVADPRFRRELAAWLHPNRSELGDGMPGYAHGLSDTVSYLAPLIVRRFEWANARAASDHELAVGSPLLAVLGSDGDRLVDWVKAGEALAHVLLHAASVGLSASFLNQAIEVPELRARLQSLLGKSGHPQLILRMGYGEPAAATPRRRTSDLVRIVP